MTRILLEIISKNFRRLWRSKISTIAIILIPFLIILFAGFAFNSSGLNRINVGVYSDAYSPLTEDLILIFEEQNFSVIKFDSLDECVSSVRNGETQICVLFPANLSESGNVDDIVFHVDYSRTNIAHALIENIKTRISLKSSDLGTSLAQNLITTLESVKGSLPEQILRLDTSESNLDYIGNKSVSNISSEDLENALDYLDSAKKLSDDSEINAYLQDTIDILDSLIISNSMTNNNLKDIYGKSKSTAVLLKEVSDKLDFLIEKIEKSNTFEAEDISSPISVKIESINSNKNNRDYMLPIVLSLIALFGGLLLSSTFILNERKSKAYFRNFMTPVKNITFLLGNYLTCLIILIVQFALVFVGVRFILNFSLQGVMGQISLILFLSLSVFVFIGMFLGYLFKSEETTIFSSVLIAVLMVFFSNAILPIEAISNTFKNVAIFNPLVVTDNLLKKVMLFGFDYSSLASELYILGAFFLVFAVLSYFARRFSKKIL